MKRSILDDNSLEVLNKIPDIDTLAIINKAEAVIEKQEARKITVIGIISCISILILNLLTLIIGGVKVFLILQGVVIWLSPIIIFPMLIYLNRGRTI